MLVPCSISSPVFHRGTAEYATPGRHDIRPRQLAAAGAEVRELVIPRARPIESGGRKVARQRRAHADGAARAEPGNPTVERPGPSLPALIVNTTLGMRREHRIDHASIRAWPSISLPTPKLMLSTSGSRRASAKRMA